MTSPFDVDIHFVGILGFVPHLTDPHKLAIVVPASDYDLQNAPKAADGKTLRRHRWFVEFNPSQIPGMASPLPANSLSHWTISAPGAQKRMTFISDGSQLALASGLDYAISFADVAPGYADVVPSALVWPPGPTGGQIMIDKGALIDPNPADCAYWAFPPTLSLALGAPVPPVLNLCQRVHLRLAGVTTFTIDVRSSLAGPAETLALVPTAALPNVLIVICNLCDHNPLRWPTAGPLQSDEDFRWYYELSANKANLPNDLYGLDLPVPYPSGAPAALGQNCLETLFKPATF